MTDWNPNIAVVGNGRVEKISKPLETTALEFSVNPDTTSKYDIIIADTPDRNMFKEFLKSKFRRQTILFRMRGDPFWGLDEWIDSRFKRYLVNDVMLKHVDGCIAIAPHQAEIYRQNTGVETQLAQLPKTVANWPSVKHTDSELRIVSLTNAVYWPKVKPLIEIAPVVDSVLNDVGGKWKIGSWSDGYSDKLRRALEGYSHIEYYQPLDAHQALANANLMIHYSNMDVLPNAILEGMASRLPVLTNNFEPFQRTDAPIVVNQNNTLTTQLRDFVWPEMREKYGHRGVQYVRAKHSLDAIGQQFKSAIQYFHDQ